MGSDRRRHLPRSGRSGELLADELADRRPVRAPGDLGHHVGHHPAEIAHAGCADLGDRVVDDPLEIVLGERLGHELLEHFELGLLRPGLFLAAGRAKGLGRFEPPLALALEDLQLLVVVQRPLELLLGGAQAREDQPQCVATLGVALLHRCGQLRLELRDQTHPGSPRNEPPRMCQCRWKTVCPAPAPQKIISRYSSSPAFFAVSATKSSIAFASSAESSPMSRNVSMWCSGMTRKWTSALGLMSSIARRPSARLTTVAGSSPRWILQKMQSWTLTLPGSHPP